jgi:hypothetical protein
MSLKDDYEGPRLLTSWADVASADLALTEAFNNLQGAASLLHDLSDLLGRTNEKYLPDIQDELVFKIQFLSDGINDAVRRGRELANDMVATLEKALPAGEASPNGETKPG